MTPEETKVNDPSSMLKRIFRVLLMGVVLLPVFLGESRSTVHVSNQGVICNGAGDGTAGNPFVTISQAIEVVDINDLIEIDSGNYRESVVLDSPMVIQAVNGMATIGERFVLHVHGYRDDEAQYWQSHLGTFNVICGQAESRMRLLSTGLRPMVASIQVRARLSPPGRPTRPMLTRSSTIGQSLSKTHSTGCCPAAFRQST